MTDQHPPDHDTRMPLTSADLTAERKEALRQLFPEVFTEGRIDFEKLKLVLGEEIDEGRERYGLTWAGKADAIRAIQVPSVGTLKPVREESVNFDTTENLMIEGDNLEVLKLLQKAYHGKIKMIYIDPPYNTGKEFIYPDNFREGLQDYLRYSGQVDGEGLKLTSNTETSGRYHSKWLSMMYPRLFLARNLLRDDGVIFVSIDDHEVHNLRHLMDEIFGPENFIATFVRRRRMATGIRGKPVSPDHEYILAYARSIGEVAMQGLPVNEEDYPYEDGEGKYRSTDLTVGMTKEMRPRQWYELVDPRNGKGYFPAPGRVWRFEPGTMQQHIASNNIIWPDEVKGRRLTRPRFKTRYQLEGAARYRSVSTWIQTQSEKDPEPAGPLALTGGMNEEATRELRELLGTQVIEYPKPVSLIRTLVAIGAPTGGLILDFFAGSGTTGDAVMRLNAADGGNRRFILVQLPEPTGRDDYPTIADITKARLRKAAEAIKEERNGKLDLNGSHDIDLGFRTYKLAASNFKIWEPAAGAGEELARQLELYADNLVPGATPEAVLYELMLKAGIPLTARVEKLELGGQEVFSIEGGLLFICLADPITRECIRAMIASSPQMVICLDHAFRGNDQLLTNTVLEMKSHGIHFRTV